MSDSLNQQTTSEVITGKKKEPGTELPPYPYRTVECHVCGNLVPEGNLAEHLMADARIIKLIKETRPEWNNKECEAYLKSLSSSRQA